MFGRLKTKNSAARLGSIEFINSLPVDLALIEHKIPCPAPVVRAAPEALNQMMLREELDVSPVSALWYAQHSEDFCLLPNLSINSASGVESVLLFTRFPLAQLHKKRILVTGNGRTTPALLEMLCRHRYRVEPALVRGSEEEILSMTGADAYLLIGDNALKAKYRKPPGFEIVDLAREWQRWVRLPLVFAVWAVRKTYYEANPEKVRELHRALVASKRWGGKNLGAVVRAAQKSSRLPEGVIRRYFSSLNFDFDERCREGLEFYCQLAQVSGFLKGPWTPDKRTQPLSVSEDEPLAQGAGK